jgi:hypothetical protein
MGGVAAKAAAQARHVVRGGAKLLRRGRGRIAAGVRQVGVGEQVVIWVLAAMQEQGGEAALRGPLPGETAGRQNGHG